MENGFGPLERAPREATNGEWWSRSSFHMIPLGLDKLAKSLVWNQLNPGRTCKHYSADQSINTQYREDLGGQQRKLDTTKTALELHMHDTQVGVQ